MYVCMYVCTFVCVYVCMCVRVRTHVCGPLHNILVLIAHAQMSASKVVVGLVERMWGWGLHVGVLLFIRGIRDVSPQNHFLP